jgi:hypothetical protein
MYLLWTFKYIVLLVKVNQLLFYEVFVQPAYAATLTVYHKTAWSSINSEIITRIRVYTN